MHGDAQQSVRALTDATGTVVETYQRDAFGKLVSAVGQITQPFDFTGEIRDSETGFIYLRSRLYDPQTGRFISRDPLAGAASSSQSQNRYSYVGNNPATLSDPRGTDFYDLIDAGPGGGGAVEPNGVTPSEGTTRIDAPDGTACDKFGIGITGCQPVVQTVPVSQPVVIPVTVIVPVVPGGPITIKIAGKKASGDSKSSGAGAKPGFPGGPGAGKKYVSKAVREAEVIASGRDCRICEVETEPGAGPQQGQLDHAWPRSRQGGTSIDNIQLLCRTCNLQKRAMTTSEYLALRRRS